MGPSARCVGITSLCARPLAALITVVYDEQILVKWEWGELPTNLTKIGFEFCLNSASSEFFMYGIAYSVYKINYFLDFFIFSNYNPVV